MGLGQARGSGARSVGHAHGCGAWPWGLGLGVGMGVGRGRGQVPLSQSILRYCKERQCRRACLLGHFHERSIAMVLDP